MTERKRYWHDGGKWLCETSYWHEDTQNCSTAFVREVSEADVPESERNPEIAASPEVAVPVQTKTKRTKKAEQS